jgi:hypothetical protein
MNPKDYTPAKQTGRARRADPSGVSYFGFLTYATGLIAGGLRTNG